MNDPTLFLAAAAALHRRLDALRRSQTELARFVEASISMGVVDTPYADARRSPGDGLAEIIR